MLPDFRLIEHLMRRKTSSLLVSDSTAPWTDQKSGRHRLGQLLVEML